MSEPVLDAFDGLDLVCDPDGAERADLVQGATAAARTLANLVVRRPVRRALDLGTGSGLLAFTLARHAERVVATDVNPRALAFARRGAQRNGIRTIDFRLGDWYAPVAGERFDLIACNPPYVVSPDSRLLYRDGSAATEGVVRAAGAHLEPGGLAHFLVNWTHDADDWVAPLRGWIAGGCDALVVHHASLPPRRYAETWAAAADVERWLAWYRAEGIGAIGAGFLLLRRRADDGPPRLHALEAAAAATPRAGVHVERILGGTDAAARDDLATLPVRVVDGVRVARETRRRAGAWQEGPARVRSVPTCGVEATVAAEDLPHLWTLDGAAPPAPAALPLARALLERGFAEAG